MALGVARGTGRFANMLYDEMDAKDISIRDFAEKIDATYEHVRKMLNGKAFPSPLMLKGIARELHVQYDKLDEAVTHDRLEKRYGKMVHKVLGQNPETAPFDPIIHRLKPEQREALMSMAKTFDRQNREAVKK